MLREIKSSANLAERKGRNSRTGRLIGMAAILVASSAAMGLAEQYPVAAAPVQSASIDRPCTQLERSAHVPSADCGTLTLNEVVQLLTAMRDADNAK